MELIENKYKKVNSLGYLGKYQFGTETLKTVGVHNSSKFLNSPELQEKAFIALLAKNKWELRDEIEKYEGTILNGIRVTESGILAAAHLGGAGSVKKYFKNNGNRFFRDASLPRQIFHGDCTYPEAGKLLGCYH